MPLATLRPRGLTGPSRFLTLSTHLFAEAVGTESCGTSAAMNRGLWVMEGWRKVLPGYHHYSGVGDCRKNRCLRITPLRLLAMDYHRAARVSCAPSRSDRLEARGDNVRRSRFLFSSFARSLPRERKGSCGLLRIASARSARVPRCRGQEGRRHHCSQWGGLRHHAHAPVERQ